MVLLFLMSLMSRRVPFSVGPPDKYKTLNKEASEDIPYLPGRSASPMMNTLMVR